MSIRPGMFITQIAKIYNLYRDPFVLNKSGASMVYDVRTNRITYNNINSGFDLSYILLAGNAGVAMSAIMTSTAPFIVYQAGVMFYARGRIWSGGAGRLWSVPAIPAKYAHYFNTSPLQVRMNYYGVNVHQHTNVVFIKYQGKSSLVILPESFTIVITAEAPVYPTFIVRNNATQKTYYCVCWYNSKGTIRALSELGPLVFTAYQITSTQFVYDNLSYVAYDEYFEGVIAADGRQKLTNGIDLDVTIIS